MNELRGLALLLVLQAVGEGLARGLQLPLPGPVIGLALLFFVLYVPSLRAPASAACELLLSHLMLLFVPIGVGVITHLDLVAAYGVRLVVVIVVSTWCGLVVTVLITRALLPAKPVQSEETGG